MQISFHFDDFFRGRREGSQDQRDVDTPTFLVQSGVVGNLKIKDLKEALLHDERARIEVDLEGM